MAIKRTRMKLFVVVITVIGVGLMVMMHRRTSQFKVVRSPDDVKQNKMANVKTPLKVIDDQQMKVQQKERKQHLHTWCESQKPHAKVNKSNLEYIIVSDDYKALYCYIPKVACSQWNVVFLALKNLTNVENVHDPKLFKFLHQYSDEEVKFRLKTYFKFLFVREPFERLLSAYENKFVDLQWEMEHILAYSIEIVENYKREDPTSDDNVTFTKFVHYVVGPGYNNNRHWNPYDKLCQPCAIDYDFVGHFENMQQEAPYVLRQTGMDRVATFPPFYSHNTSTKLLERYSEFPAGKIVELGNAFQNDFEMFNYPFPGPLSDLLRDFY